ncbi:hypothetical protein [Streptomyces profundus]|uniref:hypothetical protein n=1 Tax=Streptomyces profundus TaxID=2867410 RepID=UPI001D15F7EF|nr:hypothetical protein [Streptomyces sp. MA3_2.13]UED84422.1 hypothetical protein K4G22_09575 [Streptomyces sp. MA3_2.13]
MATPLRRLAGVLAAFAILMFFPTAANAGAVVDIHDSEPHATLLVSDPEDAYETGETDGHSDLPQVQEGVDTAAPVAWSYHITASCSGYAGSIRSGANFWGDATETSGSGTPVECVSGYVQGCGSATNVVGCNWGQGQRIVLSSLVSDFALLAAHEFGHNWYGHSAEGCANWGSEYEVMRPYMC